MAKRFHQNNNEEKDTLIALLKYRRDLDLLFREKWYRIPVKYAPKMVREGTIRYLAFYQPATFKEEAFKICWYGPVQSISKLKRRDLLPDESSHPNADTLYYRIELAELSKLANPIISRRKRRMLFITTTFQKLKSARELNDVFLESPLEERFWERLKQERIDAERQLLAQIKQHIFYLDFAIFSMNGKINVECDGDTYHTSKADVKRDKKRSNILQTDGWAVLRYTTDQINHNLEYCIQQVKETVNQYGGLQDAIDPSKHRYLDDGNNQLRLFTE